MSEIRKLPLCLNLNAAYEKLSPEGAMPESPFIKGLGWDFNANGSLNTGTGNPSNEGQNQWVLTPARSNVKVEDFDVPTEGINRFIGAFESIVTREMYSCIYNSLGNHCIFVTSGDTLISQMVILDPELAFTDNPENFIAEHRMTLRCVYDENKNIIEKHLIITDGNTWQKWVNVIASIETNSFDASIYPYWTLQPPHFDRRELIEYAPRPSMIAPLVASLPNTPADLGNDNNLIDKGFRFCFEFTYTDGRYTTVSPWSLPHFIKSEEFLTNPNLITKNLLLKLYAGSCMVERVTLYVQQTVAQGAGSNLLSWGNWYKYDAINKYTNCGVNDPVVIGNKYWLRQNAWEGLNYDHVQNIFEYVFSNDRQGQIVAQERINRVYNDMPIRNVAMADLGDGVMMGNNEYGFDNFSCTTTNGFSVTVEQTPQNVCNIPLREIKLYSYVSLAGDNENRMHFLSQVGYYDGTDLQMRFGGIQLFETAQISVNKEESQQFELDFADKNAFRCYLKGTQYYADGEWYYVTSGNVKIKLEKLVNVSETGVQDFIYSVYAQGGYFMCQYTFNVPAGQYTATLGRHNVPNAGDYRNTSTYIMGIANSLDKTPFSYQGTGGYVSITTNAIVDRSKEMEIDCISANVDTWGNGHDLFYVFAPSPQQDRWGMVEGYLRESSTVPIGMELYPYEPNRQTIYKGVTTDKNGFFFAWFRGGGNSPALNVGIAGNKNCTYNNNPNWSTNNLSIDSFWAKNQNVFAADTGTGVLGQCNRVILKGAVKSLDGSIGYSNVGVSIKDGATAYTDSDGNYELIIHNGGSSNNSKRIANVYFNAGGDFVIIGAGCNSVPLYLFNENNVPCINCNLRELTIATVNVDVQGGGQQSIKTNGKYEIGVVGGDLAGRLTFVNSIAELSVPSFLKIANVTPFFFRWASNGNLQLPDDIKWLAFYISRNVATDKYVQWVGDGIKYIDSAGNVTTDSASATFIQIGIQSLLNANITSNFSLLANYQFQKGDRLRVLDNGDGVLLDTATYGDAIDIQVEGTNYNEAAANAGLIPNTSTVVTVNNGTAVTSTDASIIVRYDKRLDILKDKKGFWIEIYSNAQVVEEMPFFEVGSFYPVINGNISIYQGGGVTAPVYTFPTNGNIDYWDTYFLKRSIAIPNVGNKYFSHPFESPNVTDKWGYNVTSGGRPNKINEDAQRRWYLDDIIKSNDFVSDGLINGLATYLTTAKKSFKGYKWGGIIAIRCINSYIFFLCENDYFTTDYNYHYARPNAQGVMVVNLSNDISDPHQKIGNNNGCDARDTQSVIMHDNFVSWHDRKNGSYMLSDYQQVFDITETIMSYYSEKTKFIGIWNESVAKEFRFDVTAGLDMQHNLLFVTFRPRRGNTTDIKSYINDRRNIQTDYQETLVYHIAAKRWVRLEGFAPEGYGKLRGSSINNEMYSFAKGIPYAHINTPTNSFSNFYGVQTTPALIVVANTNPEIIKVLQNVSQDTNNTCLWIDMIYSTAPNSFSFVPLNLFAKREGFRFSTVLRDGASYPPPSKDELYRNMFFDGKKFAAPYFIIRYVWDKNKSNGYGEINGISTYMIPLVEKQQ